MSSYAVIGLGNFGFALAKALFQGGNNVIAIDNNEDVVHRIMDFTTKAVKADATQKEILIDLGVRDVDVVIISLGEEMDTSILVTLHVKELKVPRIYAKAVTVEHGKVLEMMGVTDVIHPERDSAMRLAHQLMSPNVVDYLPFGPGFSIIEMAPPDSFLGKSIRDLGIRRHHHVEVLAVKELIPERIAFLPEPDFVLKDSDTMVLMGKDDDLEALQKID